MKENDSVLSFDITIPKIEDDNDSLEKVMISSSNLGSGNWTKGKGSSNKGKIIYDYDQSLITIKFETYEELAAAFGD